VGKPPPLAFGPLTSQLPFPPPLLCVQLHPSPHFVFIPSPIGTASLNQTCRGTPSAPPAPPPPDYCFPPNFDFRPAYRLEEHSLIEPPMALEVASLVGGEQLRLATGDALHGSGEHLRAYV
jgi:hypothetical protein